MRLIKWLFGLVLFVVILVVAAAVLLPLIIDPNDYRDEIAAQVKDKTGRDLIIEDRMSLSVFPWLGLELGKVKLGNAKGFGDEPFASIEALQLKVKLKPLFSQHVEVDTVVIDGLKLNLTTKKTGESNWSEWSSGSDDTLDSQSSSGTSTPDIESFSINVQGFDVSNAQIVWDDQQSGEHYVLNELSLKTGQLAFGSEVPVSLGMKIVSAKPRLEMDINISAAANISESKQQYAFGQLKVVLEAVGDALPAEGLKIVISSDLTLDLSADTVLIQGLAVEGPQVAIDGNIKGVAISSNPVFSGDLSLQKTSFRELLVLVGTVVETTDPNVLSNVSGNFGFSATKSSLKLAPLNVQLDDSNLSGEIDLVSFEGPVVRANLTVDTIDLDRYLPPSVAEPETETAKQSDAVATSSANDNPFAALRPLDLNATFKVGKLKVMNTRMQDTRVKIISKKGVLRIDPLTSNLYDGKINARYEIDMRKALPVIHARENLTGVQIGPLLKDAVDFDKLAGTGEVHTDLRITGLTEQQIRKSLSGTVRFTLKDGAYTGINLAQIIRNAESLLTGKQAPAEEDPKTDFSELSASAIITNGIVVNKDLKAQSPLLRISGKGKVNLPQDSIDYTLTTVLVGSLKGQGGMAATELQGVEIPVRLTGDLANPSPSVDPKALLSSKTTKQIDAKKGELKDKLKGKIKDEKLQKQLDGVFKGLF